MLLLSSQVSLDKAETRTINNNINKTLDLQAMAIQLEQISLSSDTEEIFEIAHEESETLYEQYSPQVEIRNEAAMVYTQDDLWWLALAIHYEAGSNWLSDEHQLKVGNVVLNRVASPRFAGTSIYAILHQAGQYPWATSSNHPQPSARSIQNAQRLLDGYRILPDDVIWQANFRQGKNCYSIIECPRGILRTTFFCY